MTYSEFVGVDWGTSSFRAWRCSSKENHSLIAKSGMGMSKLKPQEFAPYLEQVLREGKVPETLPILVCGMAGARGGWHEVEYAMAPAGPGEIIARAATVRAGNYTCKLLPGVSLSNDGRYDVMRGEETLLFGALNQGCGDGYFCLPGTHSKWCRIEGGKLRSWNTVMTGELFALLSTQSTLSSFCQGVSSSLHEKAEFSEAVHEVLAGDRSTMHDLFEIRARALLDPDAGNLDFGAHLSGLLIGHEISGSELDENAEITLIAHGTICGAYRKALAIAGKKVRVIDSENAVLAGLGLFAKELFENGSVVEKAT